MKVVNGTLEPVVFGDEEVDYNADLAWLGYSLGAPVTLNQSDVPVELSNANFLSPIIRMIPGFWLSIMEFRLEPRLIGTIR
jgi:hypothetical protein